MGSASAQHTATSDTVRIRTLHQATGRPLGKRSASGDDPPPCDAAGTGRRPRRDLLAPFSARPVPVPTPLPAPVEPPTAAPAGARRTLALHLPWLPTERLRRAQPELPPGPLACWAPEGNRRVLTAVDPLAAAAGLHPGQKLADARAILPAITLVPADLAADAAWLRRLAQWALCVTPLPAADPPDGLLLDVTGLAHLHEGEAPLLESVVVRFARAGITAHAALADAPDAAAALARAGVGGVVPPGGDRAALAPLPIAALRLPVEAATALARLGLRRVGEVLRQPRGPLARRFGPGLWDRLDAATGARPRPVRPLRAAPAYQAVREPLEPLITREAIDATFALLLREVCTGLEAAGLGARRMLLRAWRVDGEVQAIAIGTGLPSRDPRHLARLFRDRLERLEPDCGFERLALEARAVRPFVAAQTALPGREGPDPAARRQALAELLDRLGQRLPLWRPAPRASHWPERAVSFLPVMAGLEPAIALRRDATVAAPRPADGRVKPGHDGRGDGGASGPADEPGSAAAGPRGGPWFQFWPRRPRPVRLLRRPMPLTAVAALPDAPPALLRAGRHAWRVRRAEGPERIEPEWWTEDADQPARDYFRVELEGGRRLWVYRTGAAEWFWHGLLP